MDTVGDALLNIGLRWNAAVDTKPKIGMKQPVISWRVVHRKTESMSSKTPVKEPEWIGEKLSDASVVEWDRFTVGHNDDGDQIVTVYGWIDREVDDYKDFVLARFWPGYENLGYTTSSDEWSEWLHYVWCDGEPDGHNECRRVEHAFNVENAIELHEEMPITEF